MSNVKIIALDTETTGLDTPHAAEVCAKLCHFVDGNIKVVGGVNALYNPLKPIEEGATKINGITNDMVKHLPPITEFQLSKIGIEPTDTVYIIGHYIKYDIDCLKNTAQGDLKQILQQAKPICTKNLAQKYYNLSNNRLVTVAVEVLGYDADQVHSQAHSADYDVEMSLAFANHAIKDLGIKDIETLSQMTQWDYDYCQ